MAAYENDKTNHDSTERGRMGGVTLEFDATYTQEDQEDGELTSRGTSVAVRVSPSRMVRIKSDRFTRLLAT